MTKRVIGWISTVVSSPQPREPEVHFHSGPESRPAVCYDERCGSPRLQV